LYAGGPRRIRRGADVAGPRGACAVRRHGSRRQRADLRANTRRARPGQDGADVHRGRIPARPHRHRRYQPDDDPHRGSPLPVRHRRGERLRGHADRRYFGLVVRRSLRDAYLLPRVAHAHTWRPDLEHLMFRILHDTKFDFIKWWRHAAVLTIVFILIGLSSFIFKGGVNYSIEFTGGTLVQVKFTQPPDPPELRRAYERG